MVVDQQYVFIGSANIDPRSEVLNTEIGVMVDSKELAEQTMALFEKSTAAKNSYRIQLDDSRNKLFWLTSEHGKKVKFLQEPEASFVRKLAVFLISLLPIESLL